MSHPRHRRRQHRASWASLTLRFLTAMACGVLFALGSTLSGESEDRSGSDLHALVTRKEAVVSSLKTEIEDLRTQAQSLREEVEPGDGASQGAGGEPGPGGVEPSSAGKEAAGGRGLLGGHYLRPTDSVSGPGLVVTLTDAPQPEPFPVDLNPDDLVIHQQDIEAILNALMSGGADAVGVQGMRVDLVSQVACVGNVMNINGELFSPPYEISAIGDPQRLREALAGDEQIAIINQYVARYNLGFDVRTVETVTIAAPKQSIELAYAKAETDER